MCELHATHEAAVSRNMILIARVRVARLVHVLRLRHTVRVIPPIIADLIPRLRSAVSTSARTTARIRPTLIIANLVGIPRVTVHTGWHGGVVRVDTSVRLDGCRPQVMLAGAGRWQRRQHLSGLSQGLEASRTESVRAARVWASAGGLSAGVSGVDDGVGRQRRTRAEAWRNQSSLARRLGQLRTLTVVTSLSLCMARVVMAREMVHLLTRVR